MVTHANTIIQVIMPFFRAVVDTINWLVWCIARMSGIAFLFGTHTQVLHKPQQPSSVGYRSSPGDVSQSLTPYTAYHRYFAKKKTLVLDLDETLIHSSVTSISPRYDLTIEFYIAGKVTQFYVYKRPHVDRFLETVATMYNIVVFTASLREYADPVIDALDRGRGIITRRFFRESCGPNFGKDLSIVESDLANIVIIDNSPGAYANHQSNAIPVDTWYSNRTDEQLLDLVPFLIALHDVSDVRNILRFRNLYDNYGRWQREVGGEESGGSDVNHEY
eukprot:CFRG3530T1